MTECFSSRRAISIQFERSHGLADAVLRLVIDTGIFWFFRPAYQHARFRAVRVLCVGDWRRFRAAAQDAGRSSSLQNAGYPVVPILYILFCIVLIVNTLMEQTRDAVIGIVLILVGAPVYLYLKSKK